ncbi:MAG TPA: FxsA family protein [Longimicrobiales bacterium]|nr:FxsA family protein [Longimicrobiales bacterium]
MRVLAWLTAAFVILPVVELALLIRLGQWAGLLPTLLLVVATGVLGAALARREGLRTLLQIRSDLRGGRFPMGRLLDGVLILVAGALLLTPGVLTDLVGFAFLVPVSRGALKRLVAARVRSMVETGQAQLTVYYDEPPPGRPL